ncbi:hypothetical protein BK146_31625 [Paenibacillus sp. FSL R7-0333]|nr:hypothetical protein BK146_31625 [Paenibacillus sp. FSL R7-0333]
MSNQHNEIKEPDRPEDLMNEEQVDLLKLNTDQLKEIANIGQLNGKYEDILTENRERIERFSRCNYAEL